MAETPTLRKKLLGKELRLLRTQAGLDQEPAGALIGMRQTGMAKIEGGQSTPSLPALEKLLVNYGITAESDPDEWNRCMQWRAGARTPPNYWSGYRAVYAESFRQFVELETDCDLLQAVGAETLPDWLQTETYMRAMFTRWASRKADPEGVERAVEARRVRQNVFQQPSAPELQIIMSESSLRHEFGPPELMREAIDHVIELSKLPNFKIQVMPFAYDPGHAQAPVEYRFTQFRIPSAGRAGPLNYACTLLGRLYQYTDDPGEVSLHRDHFTQLAAAAPDYVRSRQLMIKIRDQYGR